MTDETPKQRPAYPAITRRLESVAGRATGDARDTLTGAQGLLDSAESAAAATQAALDAVDRAVAVADAVTSKIASELASIADYHHRRHRITGTAILGGVAGVGFYSLFAAAHVALPLTIAAVILGAALTIGSAWWHARATRRLFQAEMDRLTAVRDALNAPERSPR